jgi:hypothetical protein
MMPAGKRVQMSMRNCTIPCATGLITEKVRRPATGLLYSYVTGRQHSCEVSQKAVMHAFTVKWASVIIRQQKQGGKYNV